MFCMNKEDEDIWIEFLNENNLRLILSINKFTASVRVYV